MEVENEKTPLLIAFEGMDGCGKTSLINAVQDALDGEGIANTMVSMIAKCPARDYLLNDPHLTPVQQIMLIGICAIEAKKQIVQAQSEGKIVLLDRTEISRIVYQEATEGLTLENKSITAMIGEFPKIDFLVWMPISAEVAFERVKSRGQLDAIESRGIEYFSRIEANYQEAMDGFRCLQEHNQRIGRHVTQVIDIDSGAPIRLNAAMVFGEIQDYLSGDN